MVENDIRQINITSRIGATVGVIVLAVLSFVACGGNDNSEDEAPDTPTGNSSATVRELSEAMGEDTSDWIEVKDGVLFDPEDNSLIGMDCDLLDSVRLSDQYPDDTVTWCLN